MSASRAPPYPHADKNVVDQRSFPVLGSATNTVTAPYITGGYRFCYWTINSVRYNDLVGRADNPVSFVANMPIAAVAHYLPENQDSNGSGLSDAFKLEYFGTLDITSNSIPVPDGFTVGQKLTWGWNPATFNQLETGGISRRRGGFLVVVPGYVGPREHLGGISRRRSALTTVVLNPAYARLNVVSDPAGIVSSSQVVQKGVAVNLPVAPESNSGYRFTGWLTNGMRVDSPTQWQPIPITINQDTMVVARYILETADTLGVGVPDWMEWFYFNRIGYTLDSDPVGDGIPLGMKIFRGYSLSAPHELAVGGVSRRRSALTTVIVSSNYVRLNETSVPAGIVSGSRVVARGATVNLSMVPESSYGYRFTGWLTNGTRVDAPTQLQPIPISVAQDTTVVARYILETADTLGVGIPDWMEWFYFNRIGYTLDSDPDGDGFSLGMELFRGYPIAVADELATGGVSRRRSVLLPVNYFRVPPPGAVTGEASEVQSTSVTLNGVVSPNSLPTAAHFEYGTNSQYGMATAAEIAGTGTNDVAFAQVLGGLASATVYHFRLVSASKSGVTYGGDQVFTTLSPAPVFVAAVGADGTIFFAWGTAVGFSYQVQYTTNLVPANWLDLGPAIPGTGAVASATDTTRTDPQRFYRVQVFR
ncbi:MAG: InlB B-repeat-containing protein [Verrucomicrobia bacterium]|nr:InlB B-repeat-containing protein [Verrucomicrobiota bacterium]